jgi:hypothetical protein
METYQIVLLVLAIVFLLLYVQRRKGRLNRED